jgi:hypothetical protein
MRPKRTAKPKLGRLEKIHPEDYWQNAADFQHWLAEADNLELLSEALGLELQPYGEDDALEHDSPEAPEEASEPEEDNADYGLFQVPEREERVLVTAQPGPIAASHLGHLITWAADESATTVVWVAAEFSATQAHTLQWLNQLGQGRVTFWGVEVELWRIGKNAMAANFRLVCSATDDESAELAESIAEVGSEADGAADRSTVNLEAEAIPEPEPLTALQQENLDFWHGLCDRMDRVGSLVKPGNPTPEVTMGFAIARAGFRLNAILDRDHQSLYTELLLSGADAHPHFYLLAHERELIADEIGLPLIWDDAGEQTCVIASTLTGVDLSDRDRWLHYQTWFCDCLERFYEVFFDRIKQLDAAGYQPLPHRPTESLTDALILPASHRS